MKRNPQEAAIKEYLKNVTYGKCIPLFFWCQCDMCKNEFKRERIYKLKYLAIPNLFYSVKYGCSNCFDSMVEFKNYCNEKYIKPILIRYLL